MAIRVIDEDWIDKEIELYSNAESVKLLSESGKIRSRTLQEIKSHLYDIEYPLCRAWEDGWNTRRKNPDNPKKRKDYFIKKWKSSNIIEIPITSKD